MKFLLALGSLLKAIPALVRCLEWIVETVKAHETKRNHAESEHRRTAKDAAVDRRIDELNGVRSPANGEQPKTDGPA